MSENLMFNLTCFECGAAFQAPVSNARYHSTRCRARAERHRRKAREHAAGLTADEDTRYIASVMEPSAPDLLALVRVVALTGKPARIYGEIPPCEIAGAEIIPDASGQFHIILAQAPAAPPPAFAGQHLPKI